MLAEHLSEITGRPVADVLRGGSRPSLYDLKKKGIDPQSVDLGFHLIDDLPEGTPVIVDNVVGTGHTARSALRAIPGALVLVHAVDRGIDARVNPSRRKPLDKDLYADVVAEAKARFDVWPSAYASGLVVQRYKAAGGEYTEACPKREGGLTRWFKEKWVNVCEASLPACGRATSGMTEAEYRKAYPKCRPLKVAQSMTPAERKRACVRKRRAVTRAGAKVVWVR